MTRAHMIVRRVMRMAEMFKDRPQSVRSVAHELGCKNAQARKYVDSFLAEDLIEFKCFAPKPTKGAAPSLYGWKE